MIQKTPIYTNLPHIDACGHFQFVTFRTKASLDHFLEKLYERNNLPQKIKQYKIDQYLDRSQSGAFLNGEVVELLKNYFLSKDKVLYELVCFTIMPNHIHLLFEQKEELSKCMQILKGGSALLVNKFLGRQGQLWESRYYDKVVRSENQLLKTYEYIKNNSLKVGLESERFYGIYDLEIGL
jgi:REP element-mobilizing transposase RayT